MLAALAGTAGLAVGCVDRRFVVETNVPGSQVYINDRPIGPSPADDAFEYPGRYEFRAVAPGYEPLATCEYIRPRWYDWPGLDFFAEVVWPGRIEDVRRVNLTLVPSRQVNTVELLGAAENLRARGHALPAPSVPDTGPVPSSTPRPVIVAPDEPVTSNPLSAPAPGTMMR
jgi:hypothetical protein